MFSIENLLTCLQESVTENRSQQMLYTFLFFFALLGLLKNETIDL